MDFSRKSHHGTDITIREYRGRLLELDKNAGRCREAGAAFFLREYRGICINSSTYPCTCNSQLKTEETKLKLNCFQNKLQYIRWKESKHLLGLTNGHFLSIFLYVTDFYRILLKRNAECGRQASVCLCVLWWSHLVWTQQRNNQDLFSATSKF